MGGGSSQRQPDVPTAGEDLAEVIRVLFEQAPEISELITSDILRNLQFITQFGPAFATAGLAQEAQFGSITRAVESEASREAVAGEIFNVANLAPAIREAEAIASPETEALRSELSRQIGGELALGAEIDPQLRSQIEQQARRGQTARGITFGAAPARAEAFAVGREAEALRSRRRAAAENLIRLNAATQVSPFQFVTGRRGQSTVSPQVPTQGFASQFLPTLFSQQQQGSLLRAQQQFNLGNQPQTGPFGLPFVTGSAAGDIGSGLGAGLGFTGGLGALGVAGGPFGAIAGAALGSLAGGL